MAIPKKITLRRRRHHRIRMGMLGTPQRPRLIVSRSLKYHYIQLIDDINHKTLLGVSDRSKKTAASKEKKISRAKSVGLNLAKLAVQKGIKTCIFDRAGYKYHGRVKAIAEGAREGGLSF